MVEEADDALNVLSNVNDLIQSLTLSSKHLRLLVAEEGENGLAVLLNHLEISVNLFFTASDTNRSPIFSALRLLEYKQTAPPQNSGKKSESKSTVKSAVKSNNQPESKSCGGVKSVDRPKKN